MEKITSKEKEQMENLVDAGFEPLKALSHVLEKKYGSVSQFCRDIGYQTSTSYYLTLNKRNKQYSFSFLKVVSDKTGLDKDWLKSFLQIEHKTTKDELIEANQAG